MRTALPNPRRAAPVAAPLLVLLALALRAQGSTLDVVPNRGQWPAPVQARVQAADVAVWLEADGWTAALPARDGSGRGHALRLRVVDARPDARGVGEGTRPGRRHWLRGADPDAWVRHVPAYERWRWPELRPGVDLVARSGDGAFAYDLLLAPEADLGSVVFELEGVERIEPAADGGLRLHTALGVLHQSPPVAWSVLADGGRAPVDCRAEPLGERRFRFVARGARSGRPLVVDPELRWASFVGGGSADVAEDVLVDGAGGVTVVGSTLPSGYPATPGAYDTTLNGGRDGVVTRLSPDGDALVWSTVIGGAFDDELLAAAPAAGGGVLLAGWTASPDFPLTAGAHDDSFAGGHGLFASDAFLARLSADGSALTLGTLLGGSEDDMARAVACGPDGTLYLGGLSLSPDLDLGAGSPDASYGGGGSQVGDGFVAAFTPAGALRWGRYLGASGDELVNALAVDGAGALLATGWTSSPDFPVTSGAWQTDLRGTSDAWIARLDPADGELLHATLLGGQLDENALDLAVDEAGRVLLAGTTRSADFPSTPGAPQPASAGGAFYGDAYVARLAPALDGVDFATYLGGSGDEVPVALVPEAQGSVLLAGWSGSGDLPLTGDALQAPGGGTDAFVARLDPDAGALLHLSSVGAPQLDRAAGLGLCPDGELVLAGWTASPDFPVTAGAFDTSFGGVAGLVGDIFVARLELGVPIQSAEWVDLGFGLAGSAGVPALGVQGGLLPGSSGALVLEQGRPLAPTLLIFGFDAGYQPAKQGTLVPWPINTILYAVLDGGGALSWAYDLGATPLPSGVPFCMQAWVLDPNAAAGWAASSALYTTVP